MRRRRTIDSGRMYLKNPDLEANFEEDDTAELNESGGGGGQDGSVERRVASIVERALDEVRSLKHISKKRLVQTVVESFFRESATLIEREDKQIRQLAQQQEHAMPKINIVSE